MLEIIISTAVVGVFVWGLCLLNIHKASRATRIFTWIVIVGWCILFGLIATADPNGRIIHYDKDRNRIGYSIREGNRESHFSISGEREGYSLYEGDLVDRFDNEWNRQGYNEYDEPQDKD